jgi:predicted nucleic acid-binding protein
MIFVVSDTNIPSSLAAGNALSSLSLLFPETTIYIPPTVYQELQMGLERGKTHLNLVFEWIATHQISVLELLETEQQMIANLPNQLNHGEREAIALAKNRQGLLLCNDKRAVRYCQQQEIENIDLPHLLRLFWTHQILTKTQVEQLIEKMAQVENLVLKQIVRDKIFSP